MPQHFCVQTTAQHLTRVPLTPSSSLVFTPALSAPGLLLYPIATAARRSCSSAHDAFFHRLAGVEHLTVLTHRPYGLGHEAVIPPPLIDDREIATSRTPRSVQFAHSNFMASLWGELSNDVQERILQITLDDAGKCFPQTRPSADFEARIKTPKRICPDNSVFVPAK